MENDTTEALSQCDQELTELHGLIRSGYCGCPRQEQGCAVCMCGMLNAIADWSAEKRMIGAAK